MDEHDRIDALDLYVADWEKALKDVNKIRDRLLDHRRNGFSLIDKNGVDVLPDRINEVDAAVRQHEKILVRMKAFRDREKRDAFGS